MVAEEVKGPRFGGAATQRDTRQRRAILSALDRAEGFRSAQAIHGHLRESGVKVGLATVYRSLKMLSDAGDVDVVRDDSGEQLYRRCENAKHHHHLVCVSCGAAVEITSGPIELWTQAIGDEHGFANVSHSVEVFGTCETCS